MKKTLALLLCAVFLLGTISHATPGGGEVVVLSMDGDVKVVPSGKTKAQPCEVGMKIVQGSKITTGRSAYVELAFDKAGRNIVKVVENSHVVIRLDGVDKIELIDGEMYALLKGLKRGETFRVRTPSAVCGARGTAWKTGAKGKVTEVFGLQNKIFVRGIKPDGTVMEESFWVFPGMQRRIEKGKNPGEMKKIQQKKLQAMLQALGLTGPKDKKKFFSRFFKTREKQIKTLRERKNKKRLDDQRDKKPPASSGRGGKFVTE